MSHNTKSTTAYATSLIAKAGKGKLLGFSGYNSKTSAQFIQFFDSATLPADTAVPKLILSVPASSNFSVSFPNDGINCDYGMTLSNSSTGAIKTIGSADCWFHVVFE